MFICSSNTYSLCSTVHPTPVLFPTVHRTPAYMSVCSSHHSLLCSTVHPTPVTVHVTAVQEVTRLLCTCLASPVPSMLPCLFCCCFLLFFFFLRFPLSSRVFLIPTCSRPHPLPPIPHHVLPVFRSLSATHHMFRITNTSFSIIHLSICGVEPVLFFLLFSHYMSFLRAPTLFCCCFYS